MSGPAPTEQIVVLGGGPAGTAAAIALARAGRQVLLLERDAAPRHKVCGEFLSAEALHLLALLGIDPALHGARAVGTVRLVAGRHVVEAKLPFPARSLSRCCLDQLLLDKAARAGVEVCRGCTVEGLVPCGAGWQVRLREGSSLQARAVILATGKHDLRGFSRPRGSQDDLVAMKMYFQLADKETAALHGAVELLLHPEGYTGLQSVEGGLVNLTALVRAPRLAQLGGWTGLFHDIAASGAHAAERLMDAQAMLPKPLAISPIPYGFVRRAAIAPGLYAVGDQAAVIPSFTGDGMSLALFTGLSAAQSLLYGEPAHAFQHRMYEVLHRQVRHATILSRAMVHSRAKMILAGAARAWPGSLRQVAALTRIPEKAVHALEQAGQGVWC